MASLLCAFGVVVAFIMCSSRVAECARDDLASTPPIGWMSGQRYICNDDCTNYPDDCISEKLIIKQVTALKSKQLVSLGYEYVLLGDAWMARTRDSQGRLQADPQRFPSGMKSLADQVHAAGLKLGVYLSLGNETACGFPGTQGHKETDAGSLAAWGVDMVYADAAHLQGQSQDINQAYTDMAHYLDATGRPFLYSCLWPYYLSKTGAQPDWGLITKTCHTFRVYDDMIDSWEQLHTVLKHFGDDGTQYVNYTGPGHWTDPGQLLVGDFGLSDNQQEMQLAVWAVMGAPLMLSADVTSLSAHAHSLLTNKLAIAINQDPLGIMGRQKAMIGQVRIWMRPIQPAGSFALAILYENISGGPNKATLKLRDLGMTTAAAYNFTDVITGHFMGTYKPWYTFNTEVNPTGVKFIHALALP